MVGIDDAHRMGYRPHSLKQGSEKAPGGVGNTTTPAQGDAGPTHKGSDKIMKLSERPLKSVQTTLAEVGTGPAH